MSKSVSERSIWRDMKSRCQNPKNTAFKNYGGRGISVCDRWMNFDNFLSDMGPRPGNLTLDRIDNNKNYEPENVRWATRKQQNNNTRANRLVEYNGKKQTVSQWSEELNISRATILDRLNNGHSVEYCFNTAVPPPKLIEYNGKKQIAAKWASELGLNENTLIFRLRRGWSIERALNTPSKRYRLLTYKDKTLPLAQWEKLLGFRTGVLSRRIDGGWSIELAIETPVRLRKR